MRVYWIGISSKEIDAKAEFLRALGVRVELFENKEKYLTALAEALVEDAYTPTIAILSLSSMKMSLGLCFDVKTLPVDKPPHIFLLTRMASPEDRDGFYEAGGDDLLIEPASTGELHHKLKVIEAQARTILSLQNEAVQSGNMAMAAMEDSSNIGLIIGFTRQVIMHRTMDNLAAAVFSCAGRFAGSAYIKILTTRNSLYFGTEGEGEASIIRTLLEHDTGARIQIVGDVLQISQECISFQLRGIDTSDEERVGRLSDFLSQLLEMANHFIQVINQEEKSGHMASMRHNFFSTIGLDILPRMKITKSLLMKLKKMSAGDVLNPSHEVLLKVGAENFMKVRQVVNTLVELNNIPLNIDPVNISRVNAHELLELLAEKFRPVSDVQKTEIEVSADPSINLQIHEKYLSQILRAVIENAVKFTRQGRITLCCTKVLNDDRESISFLITDTGPGMGGGDIANLLSLEHQDLSRGAQCGNGLFTARMFTELLGGEINIKSKPGRGTTFLFSFPEKPLAVLENEEDSGPELF